MPYTGKVNFKDFFMSMKNAQKRHQKFHYNFDDYDNWFSDNFLEINQEDTSNEITIFKREFSENEGYLDLNKNRLFYISRHPHYSSNKILYIYGVFYDSSREREAFVLELDIIDLIDLLSYFGKSLKETTKEKYTNWFVSQIEQNKNNQHKLSILYSEFPNFAVSKLNLTPTEYQTQLLILLKEKRSKAILTILKIWLKNEPNSLYHLFNTDSITFGIYSLFYEEYGDRAELSEYVAILTQAYQIYKSNFGIKESNSLTFPQIAGKKYFESKVDIPKTAKRGEKIKPNFKISAYNLVRPKELNAFMTRVTKDKEYSKSFIISALSTVELIFKIPKDEIKSVLQDNIFNVAIVNGNAEFKAELPAILFHYFYETEYVNYINKGRVEFAINAALSIANVGISGAILSKNPWIYKFAIAEIVFESLNKAINNPIVVSQLRETATGNHFLTIWNSYVAPVGNAIFIIHGFAEIFISLAKSKWVLKAFANDKKGLKALQELTEQGSKVIDEALGLSKSSLKMMKKLKLTVKINPTTVDLISKNGDIFFRILPQDINKLMDFLTLSKATRRIKIKQATQQIRISSKAKYNPFNASKKGFKIPKSKNGICANFEKTDYLYNDKSIVKVKLTGHYDFDFLMAFKEMGITDKLEMESILKKYVWHHYDDLDENLISTFQLVSKKSHNATKTHIGSVNQLKKTVGITKIY